MKKALFVLMTLCLFSSVALAAESAVDTTVADTAAVSADIAAATDTAVVEADDTTTAADVVAPAPTTIAADNTATTTAAAAVAAPAELTVPAVAAAPESTITLKGYIIDNMCAKANKDNLADFVVTHTKDCAVMPDCEASGYSFFSEDGKLYAFEAGSQVKVIRFLSQPGNTLKVVIIAQPVGNGDLSLLSAENQK